MFEMEKKWKVQEIKELFWIMRNICGEVSTNLYSEKKNATLDVFLNRYKIYSVTISPV
jgi:hypothetical protein